LIIVLHALGSNPKLMEAMTSFSAQADEKGFLVAYPEGTKSSENGVTSWNARFCCRDAHEEGVDDVKFLSDLIDKLKDDYDVGKVLVTGFSNGGMLAHVAGVELSDKIDTIAPVGATVGKELLKHEPKRPVDVLLIHGDQDRLVPYESRGDDRFLPAREAEEYWARVNGCLDHRDEDRPEALIRRYRGPQGGCSVTSVLVKGAGHVWPGGKARMGGQPDPKTVDATALILDHFLKKE